MIEQFKLEPISKENTYKWLECLEKEKHIEAFNRLEWLGEFCYEIIVNGNLAGFISYSRWEKYCYCLSSIYILEEYRHQGIASKSINKLVFKLKKEAVLIYGFVHKDNQNAINLYKKLGFKFLSNRRKYELDTPTLDRCLHKNDFFEFGMLL